MQEMGIMISTLLGSYEILNEIIHLKHTDYCLCAWINTNKCDNDDDGGGSCGGSLHISTLFYTELNSFSIQFMFWLGSLIIYNST